jgi:hypothetical protein
MEIANLLLSVAAVAIAALSLWHSWSLQKKQNELAAKQLELANAQLSSRMKADIICLLQKVGNTKRIVVTNAGQAVAKDITLEIEVPEGRSSPLCDNFDKVFPVKSLPPGHSVSIPAALTLDTGTSFNCKCSWKNEDETIGEKFVPLTL